MLPHQLADKGAPSDLRSCQGRAPIAPRLVNVTSAAKGLKVGRVPGVAATPHRRDVIALQPTRPAALDTAPAVALKDGASHSGPAAGIQVGVVATQLVLVQTSSEAYNGVLSDGLGTTSLLP